MTRPAKKTLKVLRAWIRQEEYCEKLFLVDREKWMQEQMKLMLLERELNNTSKAWSKADEEKEARYQLQALL